MPLLRLLGGSTRLTHLRRFDFGDDRYARNRLLDHIDDDGFNGGGAWRLHCPHFFRDFFAPRLSFALAGRFLGIAWLRSVFAGLFRADVEGLRALRRAIGFLFRIVARFFR
jgi:hypothetical protein